MRISRVVKFSKYQLDWGQNYGLSLVSLYYAKKITVFFAKVTRELNLRTWSIFPYVI